MARSPWCILTFASGAGRPFLFDPPRRLVVLGPYRFVRNPMYLGAAAALGGAALYYQSLALAAYAGVFLLLMTGFVVVYEEPTLRATFGGDYDQYCRDATVAAAALAISRSTAQPDSSAADSEVGSPVLRQHRPRHGPGIAGPTRGRDDVRR